MLVPLLKTELTIYDLRWIDGETFQSYSNLETLNCDGFLLTKIEPNSFSNATKLTNLNLSGTGLKCLKENAFQGLANLRVLNLSNLSSLKIMKSWVFNGVVNLQELDLSGVSFLSKKSTLPKCPATLKVLSLSKCGLTRIEPGSFDNLPALEKLDLSVNKLVQFDLTGCAAKVLNLARNNLASIKFSIGNDLISPTEELDLSKNSLAKFEYDDLINLSVLDLSNNKLADLQLSKCSSRVLDASCN
jgi:Leucine-rich repeat (LRR) protein